MVAASINVIEQGDIKLVKEFFERIVKLIKKPNNNIKSDGNNVAKMSQAQKLRIYGLYKRCTEGKLVDSDEVISKEEEADENDRIAYRTRPSFLQVNSRSKYDAWLECSPMRLHEARLEYIQMTLPFLSRNSSSGNPTAESDDEEVTRFHQDYEMWQRTIRSTSTDSHPPQPQQPTAFRPEELQDNVSATYKSNQKQGLYHYVLSALNFMKLFPRGTLDISWADFLYATYYSFLHILLSKFFPSSKEELLHNQLSDQIENVWLQQVEEDDKDIALKSNVLTTLSVRSAFDLYLQAKQYPPGSSIVMSAIQIEGMVHVAQFHGLTIIPVDCTSIQNVAPSVSDIVSKITPKTVAVLIAHAFGFIGYSEMDFQDLKQQLISLNIDLIEDCAECFPYRGSCYSDVIFFSFGVIKTCTSLGGGISIFRDDNVYHKMKQLQKQYKMQTNGQFFWNKVFKCIFLKWISNLPLLCGILFRICEYVSGDVAGYDKFVTSSVKGFPTGACTSQQRQQQLMRLLRHRPSCTNLALLYRRLTSPIIHFVVKQRIQRCKQIIDDISTKSTKITFPGCEEKISNRAGRHYYWLLPIMVDNPDQVTQQLLKAGFDVPRGTSQLGCIANFLLQNLSLNSNIDASLSCCPIATNVMSKILYLPVASYGLSSGDTTRLIDALTASATATATAANTPEQTDERSKVIPSMAGTTLIWKQCNNCMFALAVSFIFGPLSSGVMASTCFVLIYYLLTVIAAIFFAVSVINVCLSPLYLKSSEFSRSIAKFGNKTCAESTEISSNKNDAPLELHQKLDIESLRLPTGTLNRGTNSSLVCEKQPKVLLTGATGFVGSMLLHDLLLHRDVLGISGGVVVLCRSKGNVSAKDRMHRLLESSMFSFLSDSEKKCTTILTVIECDDLSCPNIGLSEVNRRYLADLNVTHVIHCAAAVSFLQPLEEAALANITPALQMQSFIKENNWNAKYVHVSTAFVHGPLSGSPDEPLPEKLHRMGNYDPYELYKSMMDTQSLASAAMRELGFPNSYTFSKCICEHLLLRDKSIDTIIIRPSIVGPSVANPWEGWAGSKPSTFIAAACLFLKNQWSIWSFGSRRIAVIPVDVTSRFILRQCFSKKASSPKRIYNATWNNNSSESTCFTWNQFAESMVKMGSIQNRYSRLTACLFHFVNVNLLPSCEISRESFSLLHRIIVRAPIQLMQVFLTIISKKRARNVETLLKYLDLPILFLHFSSSNYYFMSDLEAPATFNGQRYMMSCCFAAEGFMKRVENVSSHGSSLQHNVIAGKYHNSCCSDLWWAVTQPQGNIAIRLAGYVTRKLLRYSVEEVAVDLVSFAELSQFISDEEERTGSRPHIVLAPTHRSFYDFLLISYLCFTLPELGISIPFICASAEFSRIPVLGFFASCAQAFFVKRDQGKLDPQLVSQVKRLKNKGSATFEVFIEGKRSRDRRFVPGKMGFLKCLQNTGGDHIILPICINYELIPEQSALAKEIEGRREGFFSATGLFRWLRQVFKGNVNLGRIQISASKPSLLRRNSNLTSIVAQVQTKQQSLVKVSNFHVDATCLVLGIQADVIWSALQSVGCQFWLPQEHAMQRSTLCMPNSNTELWTIMLQWGHFLAPFLSKTGIEWGYWLNPCRCDQNAVSNLHIDVLVAALKGKILQANQVVDSTVRRLKSKGFSCPTKDHVLQYLSNCSSCPHVLALAAIEFMIFNDVLDCEEEKKEADFDLQYCDKNGIEIPRPIFRQSSGATNTNNSSAYVDKSLAFESFGAWGFSDSGFVMNISENRKIVHMRGNRYKISGRVLPNLVPFIEKEMGVILDPTNVAFSKTNNGFSMDECELSQDSLAKLYGILKDSSERSKLDRVSTLPIDRLRHGTGQTQADMYILRSKKVRKMRFPDCVVWPVSEEEVKSLVQLATIEKWCIIPFGGGTNVSHATWCPSKKVEPRPIISVDMKRMNRIIWINSEDGCAHIEAGISGRDLVVEMERRGFTIGHEPDSIEFSTLGGWIATKASGMKRNKYGNIEDIVKEVRVISPAGVLFHNYNSLAQEGNTGLGQENRTFGRVATGMDLCPLMMGSEGCLGIISSAVIKVWPIAECKKFDCIILPSFDVGVRLVKDLSKVQSLKPASVRLVDNVQFRLGQALKQEPIRLWDTVRNQIMHIMARSYFGFSPDSVVGVSIAFEGSVDEVQAQETYIRKLSLFYGGFLAGSNHGQAGYDLTFAIAYLRDFAMTYHCLGDSFETFVPWSMLHSLIDLTKNRIRREHEARCLPGKPLISCRVTQLYDEGACVYFYFCMYTEQVLNPSEVFSEIEAAARDEIVKAGGSLSHHHGIGKLRCEFMDKVTPSSLRGVFFDVKKSFDPCNVFGARNGIFHHES